MRWQWKATILRGLDLVPGGKQAYLTAQRCAGTTRPQARRDLTRVAELIAMIDEAGQSVERARCFEIGTGWHPFTPLGLYLAGANRILTVDVNPWLSLRSARQAIAAAESQLAWFADKIGQPRSAVLERFACLDRDAKSLAALLQSFRCEYRYPGDATTSGEPDQSYEFVVSSNVLEHVPPRILEGMCTEALRILTPGGLFVHRFNPGDHYANTDARITTANFLRFNDQQWRKYGSGLAYHNRLRCSEFLSLFRKAGFLGLIEETRIDPLALAAIEQQQIPLADQFCDHDPSDLAADYMWYVGMKASAVSGVADVSKKVPAYQSGATAGETV